MLVLFLDFVGAIRCDFEDLLWRSGKILWFDELYLHGIIPGSSMINAHRLHRFGWAIYEVSETYESSQFRACVRMVVSYRCSGLIAVFSQKP